MHLFLNQRERNCTFFKVPRCRAGKKVSLRASGSELTAKAKPGSLPQTQLTFTRSKFAKSKQKKSTSASNSPSTREVKERPLKERLIHLLVLRPYKRSELLLRLQKDGLTDRDGDGLDAALREVRCSSSRRLSPVLTTQFSANFLSSHRWVILATTPLC